MTRRNDTRARWARRTACATALVVVLAACGGDDGDDTSDPTDPAPGGDAEYTVRNVPGDHATIQEAVDAAEPGDLVLIEPGVYEEAVTVDTPEIVIRGLDRNETILDGGFELDNGFLVVADGVAVENLTTRNYARNGVFWTGVTGYRGSYLTATRTGDYGLYAFDSVDGILEDSYGSGSPDAGFYIGQCYPCNAIVRDVISEYNGLGYSGTNAGGDLYIINSTWRYNRAGIVPNTGSYELCYPERETTMIGNIVYSNNQPDTPAISAAMDAMGNGILVAGGIDNLIERNLVFDHDITGIAMVPFPEDGPSDDIPEELLPCDEAREQPLAEDPPASLLWPATGNVVRDNVVEDSRVADLGVNNLGQTETPDGGNCFEGNTFETSGPADIETKAPCEGEAGGDWTEGALDVAQLIAREKPEPIDYAEAPTPDPPLLPGMDDPANAPPEPAVDLDLTVDLDAIAVPARPDEE